MSNNPIGVINEQGFVAGSGLGFMPTTLNESNKTNEEKKEEEKK